MELWPLVTTTLPQNINLFTTFTREFFTGNVLNEPRDLAAWFEDDTYDDSSLKGLLQHQLSKYVSTFKPS